MSRALPRSMFSGASPGTLSPESLFGKNVTGRADCLWPPQALQREESVRQWDLQLLVLLNRGDQDCRYISLQRHGPSQRLQHRHSRRLRACHRCFFRDHERRSCPRVWCFAKQGRWRRHECVAELAREGIRFISYFTRMAKLMQVYRLSTLRARVLS
jgi:hypothetical protein